MDLVSEFRNMVEQHCQSMGMRAGIWNDGRKDNKNIIQIETGSQQTLVYVLSSNLKTDIWWGLDHKQLYRIDKANVAWFVVLLMGSTEQGYVLTHEQVDHFAEDGPFYYAAERDAFKAHEKKLPLESHFASFEKCMERLALTPVRSVQALGTPSERAEFSEGDVEEITVELRKRNQKLREEAIAQQGTDCCVCGFSFGRFYGDVGDGYAELHHLQPLSQSPGERVTTTQDVAVVCANCHRILHRYGSEPMPVDALRKVVKDRQQASHSREQDPKA